ncbi:electron transport complex subunit RsxE, partial [Pseudidiomarina aestuarii]
AVHLRIDVFTVDYPLLLAILPPGAFIVMGFIIALKNMIDHYREQRAQQPDKVVTRARVTAQ